MFLQKSAGSDSPVDVHVFDKASTPLTSVLQSTLADVISFYLRAHGAHWNVKGTDFAQYHELFGEIYEDVQASIDPLAENLLKLGDVAPYRFSELVSLSSIGEAPYVTNPRALASDLSDANDALIARFKMAFAVADASNEQGVANFIAERIDMHQKWAWQLKSSLDTVEKMNRNHDARGRFASGGGGGGGGGRGSGTAKLDAGIKQARDNVRSLSAQNATSAAAQRANDHLDGLTTVRSMAGSPASLKGLKNNYGNKTNDADPYKSGFANGVVQGLGMIGS